MFIDPNNKAYDYDEYINQSIAHIIVKIFTHEEENDVYENPTFHSLINFFKNYDLKSVKNQDDPVLIKILLTKKLREIVTLPKINSFYFVKQIKGQF
jgi:hypothetical protein